MRVRIPDISPPEEVTEKDKRQSITYNVKIITPIYGGGVKAGEPDDNMPIRASAIRGQLRYWWRFLATNREDSPLSDKALFEAEREIWGGMGDTKELKKRLIKGKDFSSKVFIKVDAKPTTSQQITTAKDIIGHNNGIGYALFSAIQNDENHKLIKAGYTFTLTISLQHLSEDAWDSILLSIRWWVCFGGIGARTRRGLGSVEILKTINSNGDEVDFKPLEYSDVTEYRCDLKTISATSAMDSWNKAVGKLHHFRQVEFQYNRNPNQDHKISGIGRKIKNQQKANDNIQKSYPSRSNWPEPDSIREMVGRPWPNGHHPEHPAKKSFPRASFGLPIIFDFVNDAPPEKTELIPIFPKIMTQLKKVLACPALLS